MLRSRRPLVGCCLVLFALLLAGCGGEGEVGSVSEWTIAEEALTLERTLFVGDDEDFYFGSVGDVAVASEGRMYGLDWDARHVKVVGPDGGLQDTLGRKGSGPGEFQRPREIVVARGDSLYVLDPRGTRISVFTPGGAFAYSRRAEFEGSFPEGFMVPDEQSGFVLSYTSLPTPGSGEEGTFAVRRVHSSERPADTILTARSREGVSRQMGEAIAFRFIPFGREPHVAMGPGDRVYFGQSDSLRLSRYTLDGTRRGTDILPFESVPVTDDEREAVLGDISSDFRSKVGDRMPSTKPAFDDVLIDDEGRYWFGRPTATPDSTDWWVAWPDEKRVATTTLPNEVRLTVVRNGRAYGRTTTENGAPALVRYRIRDPSN